MSTASTVRSGGWRLDSHERAALFDPLLVNNPIGVQVLGIARRWPSRRAWTRRWCSASASCW